MSWIVGPSTSSSDNLERLMQTFGWKSDLIPGMAVDLAGLHQRQARWSGITVERVEHAESLQQWMQIAAAVSQFPDFVLDYALNALQTHGFVRHPQVEYYLGRLDGEAVATSALVLGGGVAGIYIVTTLPAARGKGLGTAVTLVPLLDARIMGYRVGILQSSDMGFNVYQRLGFQQYCSFNFCFFAAPH
jgi:GNAT superfamily N-acetyltransferase